MYRIGNPGESDEGIQRDHQVDLSHDELGKGRIGVGSVDGAEPTENELGDFLEADLFSGKNRDLLYGFEYPSHRARREDHNSPGCEFRIDPGDFDTSDPK